MSSVRKIDSARKRRFRAKLTAMQGGCCCYCATQFADEPWSERYATIEHIEDRAKGGVNAQTNLAMACFACNQRAAKERWSVSFKRARIEATNVIALADLEVEHMELPPAYLARSRSAA